MSPLRAIWRARWNTLRLALAALIVWALTVDTPTRLARLQLASLPDADFAGEVRMLREQGRLAEAVTVADAGLAVAPATQHAAITLGKQAAEGERRSTLRRLRDLGRGALTGGGSQAGEASLEVLLGAVATDLLVIGDVRDLVIQSARFVRGEETDSVIIALSGVGLITTLAPEIDWAPSVLKAARRAGAMTDGLARSIVSAARGSDGLSTTLKPLLTDTATIARHASPAGALRIMKHIDTPEDAASAARFLERTGAGGAHALRSTGKQGVEILRSADALRSAGRLDEAALAEGVLMKCAAKGEAGRSFLARGLHRPLLRSHPLVGIAKSLWKGNAQALIARALERLDPFSSWTLPAAAAWLFIELCLLLRRFVRVPITSAGPGRAHRGIPAAHAAG